MLVSRKDILFRVCSSKWDKIGWFKKIRKKWDVLFGRSLCFGSFGMLLPFAEAEYLAVLVL